MYDLHKNGIKILEKKKIEKRSKTHYMYNKKWKNYNYISMRIIFVILLIFLCRNQIIVQSNTNTVIKDVGKATLNTYPYPVNGQIPNTQAKWIWSNGWDAAGCQRKIVIKGEFWVKSKNPLTFYITADNSFQLQIDGTQILSGNDWQTLYSKTFFLRCGKHRFKITANNEGDCSSTNPAGLIYALIQDTSSRKCHCHHHHHHSRQSSWTQ